MLSPVWPDPRGSVLVPSANGFPPRSAIRSTNSSPPAPPPTATPRPPNSNHPVGPRSGRCRAGRFVGIARSGTYPAWFGGADLGPRLRPRSPCGDRDRDDLAWRPALHVLGILRASASSARSRVVCVGQHQRRAVDAHPPQSVPVLLVVIDEQRHLRMQIEVAQSSQRERRLRLRRLPTKSCRRRGRSSTARCAAGLLT